MKIGIIEDDYQINNAINIILSKEGYEVVQGHSCLDGIKLVKEDIDLLLLDINLPDGEGFEVCKHISKDKNIPVIFLTARDEEIDMINAYDEGCEDYIIKPFSMNILIKRIEVVLRRQQLNNDLLIYKKLKVDTKKHRTFLDGQIINLTNREYEVLTLLLKRKETVVPKEFLLDFIWDSNEQYVEENTLSVTINRLRKKISIQNQPSYIRTIFGIGYLLGE